MFINNNFRSLNTNINFNSPNQPNIQIRTVPLLQLGSSSSDSVVLSGIDQDLPDVSGEDTIKKGLSWKDRWHNFRGKIYRIFHPHRPPRSPGSIHPAEK